MYVTVCGCVQDRHGGGDEEPPSITVVVAEGLEDVTIKVSSPSCIFHQARLHDQ
jgi:hypothetical protein